MTKKENVNSSTITKVIKGGILWDYDKGILSPEMQALSRADLVYWLDYLAFMIVCRTLQLIEK